MSILNTRDRQRGVSALMVIGSLLIAVGIAGLGIALSNSGNAAIESVSSAARDKTGRALPGDTRRGVATDVAATVAKTGPQIPGPNPAWHGSWRGDTPDARMLITAAGVGGCKWINAPTASFNSDCESGYAASSVSVAEILRRFEESVAAYQSDPSSFKISEPGQSRRLISRIKPGNYRVIWTHDGSDCGLEQMIVDGDVMLRIVDCKYRHQISMLTREVGTSAVVATGAHGEAKSPGSITLPTGRWAGSVSQPGYAPYPAVMQLQPTATGGPVGTMAYPSMPCTASLTFSKLEGDAFWFRESIQEGRGKCMDGVRISISPRSDGTVILQFFVAENLNTPVATGTFRR